MNNALLLEAIGNKEYLQDKQQYLANQDARQKMAERSNDREKVYQIN